MIELAAGSDLDGEAGSLLIVPVFAGRTWGPGGEQIATELGDELDAYLDEMDFDGGSGQVAMVPRFAANPFATVLFVGLGEETDADGLRRAGGIAGRAASKSVGVATTIHQLDVSGGVAAFVEGFVLGQYRFDEFRSEPKPAATRRLRFVGDGAVEAATAGAMGLLSAQAVKRVRDLVNTPSGNKGAETVAAVAVELGARFGFSVSVLDEAEIAGAHLGGLAAVAAGAHRPPRLVTMRYEPEGAEATVVFVGKGIIFDSGGLSLKPPVSMETMKTDMSGAAAVISAMAAIAEAGLRVNVVGITPLAENMPGGNATRPGDVFRARNGKTVEVLNTDAEGRLVLADGLSLAAEEEPDLIVDAATLTGACMVALGRKVAGVWSNDDQALQRALQAGKRAGEALWAMPLDHAYRADLDSEVADLKNIGAPKYGGAIYAALFLEEFVGGHPWVHLDIAGPARSEKDEHYLTKGGTGFGVRTLFEIARSFAPAE